LLATLLPCLLPLLKPGWLLWFLRPCLLPLLLFIFCTACCC
jgi:hypothetical protein